MLEMEKINMEEEFKGYNLYTEKEYEEIWSNSVIVLDTNILLNFFRYSSKTRANIIKVLKELKKRIWIPYQVIKEYYKNRDIVIKESQEGIRKLEENVKLKIDDVIGEINKYNKNIEEIDKLKECLKQTKENTNTIITKIKEEKDKEKTNKEDIKIEKEILNLIENNYESKYIYSEKEKVIEEGDKRIKEQIPKGYKDDKKKDKYKEFTINGDYIIFNSIIEYAKEKNSNVIFITDDKKEDWFHIIAGEKKGGRPELLNEFYKKTKKLMLVYTSDGFFNQYNNIATKEKLSEETLKEIEKISDINEHLAEEYHDDERTINIFELEKYNKKLNIVSKNADLIYFKKLYNKFYKNMIEFNHTNNSEEKLNIAVNILLVIERIGKAKLNDKKYKLIFDEYKIKATNKILENNYKEFLDCINILTNILDI